MSGDIRARIAARRARDVDEYGAAQGLALPEKRTLPIVTFLQGDGVICEVKRCSPSVSNIDKNLDPIKLSESYAEKGVTNISVLTEQNYFDGSLDDLIRIKTALPELAVLRKDFLLTEEDVKISWRAGADAFLLIASLLDVARLKSMYELGKKLGLAPVVELHNSDDVAKASLFKPEIVGINSRDLRTFKIKPTQPLKIRSMIDWDCRIIYESGIKTEYDIDFVKGTGFDAVLVGEAVVKNSSFIEKLIEVFNHGAEPSAIPDRFSFWSKLYGRCTPGIPLVKICGITNQEDLRRIVNLRADIAGFILADSPRRVDPSFIESCSDFDILKVGVVVLKRGELLPEEVAGLLRSGALDAIQFHGDELPEQYLNWPGYKAARIKSVKDVESAALIAGPVVLIDAFSAAAPGGTGKRIAPALVEAVAANQALWLAGGITPDNVCDIIEDFRPELIDISSGVELSPGKKDPAKLVKLFEVLNG